MVEVEVEGLLMGSGMAVPRRLKLEALQLNNDQESQKLVLEDTLELVSDS